MSQAHVHTIGSIGEHIRAWRVRRRRSQLDLACDAEISCRHLSFIETGRSVPSRAMILRLAEELEVPPRERNVLLTAAGFAPVFPEHALSDAALVRAREAIDHIIASQAALPRFRPRPALEHRGLEQRPAGALRGRRRPPAGPAG